MMKLKIRALLMAAVLLLSVAASAQVDAEAVAQTPVKFYQSLNSKDYVTCWSLLTEASKTRLATLVAEEAKMPVPDVRRMFDSTDPAIRDGFWESFRGGSKPEVFVTLSYQYASEKDGGYIVSVSDPGAANGKTLEMIVKDEGGYKFGLAESFDL